MLFTNTNGKRDIAVRSLMSLIFAIGATAGFFMELVTADSYMALVTMAVSFYFAKRDDPTVPKDDTINKTTVTSTNTQTTTENKS